MTASFQGNTKKILTYTQKIQTETHQQTLNQKIEMRCGGLPFWVAVYVVLETKQQVVDWVGCPMPCYAPDVFRIKSEKDKEKMMEKF